MRLPDKKSSLSAPRQRLIELMQTVNFGRIEGIRISAGEPATTPSTKVIRKLKMGADNESRPEMSAGDFRLKQQTQELFETMSDLSTGDLLSIEVRHGLPFTLEVIRQELSLVGAFRDE